MCLLCLNACITVILIINIWVKALLVTSSRLITWSQFIRFSQDMNFSAHRRFHECVLFYESWRGMAFLCGYSHSQLRCTHIYYSCFGFTPPHNCFYYRGKAGCLLSGESWVLEFFFVVFLQKWGLIMMFTVTFLFIPPNVFSDCVRSLLCLTQLSEVFLSFGHH